MSRSLPILPSLLQQRHLAKDLQKAWRSSDPAAYERIRALHPRCAGLDDRSLSRQDFKLADAQLVLAREYGFQSWQHLKRRIEQITGVNQNEQAVRLARAVTAGDRAMVHTMLRRNPQLARIDLAHTNEHRALHYAVRQRDSAMIHLLLEAGADPGQGVWPLREPSSPRTIAADRGYHEIMAIFEQFDERRRQEARCPSLTISPQLDGLAEAIRHGRDDEVKNHLRADPSLLESCDEQGETVIHHAARWGRTALIDRLIMAGAHLNKMNVEGDRALDLAVRKPGSEQIRADCRQAAALLRQQKKIIVSLETAIALGEEQTVRALAAAEPQRLRPAERQRCGLLQIAIDAGQDQMVAVLLDLGCDPDDQHRLPNLEDDVLSAGEPLGLAVQAGNLPVASLLLAKGAQVNAEVYASGNALARAYNHGNVAMIALLTGAGGMVSIETALLEGDATLVKNLLAQRPSVTVELLTHAICGGNLDVVRVCLARVPDWREHSYRLLYNVMRTWRCGPFRHVRDFDQSAYVRIMQVLLEEGADANAVGIWGFTPLHETAVAGLMWDQDCCHTETRLAFARLLLDHGATLDVREEEMLSTPLGWAARWGRLELVEQFLKRGASTNLPEDQPWATPLAWAEKKGHAAVIELLVRHDGRPP